jgi:ABC-2 type transport system permease protein
LIRFVRQPARVAAAIGTPLLLWLFMGSGFAGSFHPRGLEETSYMAFLLPGVITLTAMFTAVFSSISIIEDRQAGWLQSALVAPVPRWAIALGKIAGGSIVAGVQAVIMLLAIPLLEIELGWIDLCLVLTAIAVLSLAMTGLGVAFAWLSETVAGFHSVMNLVLMPLWLLSGAFFPPPTDVQGPASWLGWLMRINPLTWCTQSIRNPIMGDESLLPLAVACGFAALMTALAAMIVAKKKT